MDKPPLVCTLTTLSYTTTVLHPHLLQLNNRRQLDIRNLVRRACAPEFPYKFKDALDTLLICFCEESTNNPTRALKQFHNIFAV
ncbi:hypothetical protein CPB83DRAFT_858954 [Crepidotus variabilis]|uniref:Uncharacterized protein n=1 Tax=Crepidotus variabilis TaxID=179855 RepID=A0A9P6EB28_9AGAR|nr:hypothetical protein CPB83DRAFT_858954 [Crepidotus variabilis]